MSVQITSINYFFPIFAFLLVFIVVYAILKKTEILGKNNGVAIFISLIIASFFIVNVKLVEFVQFNSAWLAVFLICTLFILMFLGFIGKDYLEVFTKTKAFAYVLIFLLIAFFIFSAARIFNWVINWAKLTEFFYTEWFGLILLFVIAGIVAAVLSKSG